MKRLYFILLFLSALLLLSCQKEQMFNITTSVSPEGAGTVSPSSMEAQEGSTLSLTATPGGEYVFTGWSGSISRSENPVTITVTSDMNVRANFTLRSYPLSLSCEGEGKIAEKILSTKSEYTSGTVVELTAQPSQHWQFSHWEGDLSGTENPIQITISTSKSVKAVFTKKSYDYNLKIVGPGAVDEEIVQNTKATLEAGTIVRLSAWPDKKTNSIFTGWSGDVTGSDPVIEVNIDEVKNIIATFTKDDDTIPFPALDLSLPSRMMPRLIYGKDYSSFSNSPYKFCYLDYNKDGLMDIVTSNASGEWGVMNWVPDPITFYLGQPDGSFIRDKKNDSRFAGLIGTRKIIYGDYNGDDYPDLFFVAGGYDFEPFPGEYCVLLTSSTNGIFSETRFVDMPAHYHGGASGDIDNDGDLDIVTTVGSNPIFFINDGYGHFETSKDLIDYQCERMFNCELYDINDDGYLDFICGGHSWEGPVDSDQNEGPYNNDPIIFWGNGVSFSKERSTRLPRCSVDGFGLVCDFLFYDLDSDGKEEIIISRTGDDTDIGGTSYYGGWYIQVVKETPEGFIDATSQYISLNDAYDINPMYSSWLVWLDIADIDGKKYLLGAYDYGMNIPYSFKVMEISNGRLSRVLEPVTKYAYKYGFPIYGDSFYTCSNVSFNTDSIKVSFKNAPFGGTDCIYWKADDAWKQEFTYRFNAELDLTTLINNDYEIEFYLKNSNPDLSFFINFETDYVNDGNVFCYYQFNFTTDQCNGQWQRIHVPLKLFSNTDIESLWSKIKLFKIFICSENTKGTEFYLDEIRIRKAL